MARARLIFRLGACFFSWGRKKIVLKKIRSGEESHTGELSCRVLVLKTRFFLNCAPPPHQTIKTSRGWLRVGVSKPRVVLFNSKPTRNKVTAKERTDVLGCADAQSRLPPCFPWSRGAPVAPAGRAQCARTVRRNAAKVHTGGGCILPPPKSCYCVSPNFSSVSSARQHWQHQVLLLMFGLVLALLSLSLLSPFHPVKRILGSPSLRTRWCNDPALDTMRCWEDFRHGPGFRYLDHDASCE